MQKERIFAFKGYGQYYFYNEHDLNSFWVDSLEWCGGKWEIHDKDFIINAHKQNLNDSNMEALTESEFVDFIKKLSETDKEFSDYLSTCELFNGNPIEDLF